MTTLRRTRYNHNSVARRANNPDSGHPHVFDPDANHMNAQDNYAFKKMLGSITPQAAPPVQAKAAPAESGSGAGMFLLGVIAAGVVAAVLSRGGRRSNPSDDDEDTIDGEVAEGREPDDVLPAVSASPVPVAAPVAMVPVMPMMMMVPFAPTKG